MTGTPRQQIFPTQIFPHLTSKASGEDEQKALESGFLDFIPKPVQPIRVVSRVKRAFEIVNNRRR